MKLHYFWPRVILFWNNQFQWNVCDIIIEICYQYILLCQYQRQFYLHCIIKKYLDIHFWYQMILLNWWEIYATIFVHQWSVSEKVVEDPQKYMYVIKGMYTQEHRLLFLLQSIVDHLSLTGRITFITLSWRSYNNTALMRVYSCTMRGLSNLSG